VVHSCTPIELSKDLCDVLFDFPTLFN